MCLLLASAIGVAPASAAVGRRDWTLETLEIRLQREGPARLELDRNGTSIAAELSLRPIV